MRFSYAVAAFGVVQLLVFACIARHIPFYGDEVWYFDKSKLIAPLVLNVVRFDFDGAGKVLDAIIGRGWFMPGMSIVVFPVTFFTDSAAMIRLYLGALNFAAVVTISGLPPQGVRRSRSVDLSALLSGRPLLSGLLIRPLGRFVCSAPAALSFAAGLPSPQRFKVAGTNLGTGGWRRARDDYDGARILLDVRPAFCGHFRFADAGAGDAVGQTSARRRTLRCDVPRAGRRVGAMDGRHHSACRLSHDNDEYHTVQNRTAWQR